MVLLEKMDETSPTKYTNVSGFFLQDEPNTDPKSLDYVTIYAKLHNSISRLTPLQAASDFGLIKREYDTDKEYDPEQKKTQWERFYHKVSELNLHASSSVRYKVIYMVVFKSSY